MAKVVATGKNAILKLKTAARKNLSTYQGLLF